MYINEFKNNPILGVVGTQISQVDKNGNLIRNLLKPGNDKQIRELSRKQNVIGNSTMMIKRDLLEQVGMGYRVFFSKLSYQDYDLSLLLMEKCQVKIADEYLYFYRQHANSNSKKVEIERRIAFALVQNLAKQREEFGKDYLQMNDNLKLNQLIEKLRTPYVRDHSLVFREYAADFIYQKLYSHSVKTSFQGCKAAPLNLQNWRTLLYCVRQKIKYGRKL